MCPGVACAALPSRAVCPVRFSTFVPHGIKFARSCDFYHFSSFMRWSILRPLDKEGTIHCMAPGGVMSSVEELRPATRSMKLNVLLTRSCMLTIGKWTGLTLIGVLAILTSGSRNSAAPWKIPLFIPYSNAGLASHQYQASQLQQMDSFQFSTTTFSASRVFRVTSNGSWTLEPLAVARVTLLYSQPFLMMCHFQTSESQMGSMQKCMVLETL